MIQHFSSVVSRVCFVCSLFKGVEVGKCGVGGRRDKKEERSGGSGGGSRGGGTGGLLEESRGGGDGVSDIEVGVSL